MNFWKRYISFKIGEKEYKSPWELAFESSFNLKGGSVTRASVYNPSDEMIANAEPQGGVSQSIIINAGFEKDYGVCVIGEIFAYTVHGTGVDKILEMHVGDSVAKWSKVKVCRTWQKNIKASAVINDLINMFELDIGKIEAGTDKKYQSGISFNCKLKVALEQMAKETESDFFLRNGRLYFQSKEDDGIKTGVQLTSKTGLLKKPEKIFIGKQEGWKIKSLFNYKIGSGEFISIESSSLTGDSKVVRGRHYYTDKEAYTEMEVVRV